MEQPKQKIGKFLEIPRNLFISVFVVDFALLALFTYIVHLVIKYRLSYNASDLFASLTLTIVFAISSYKFFKMINPVLGKIEYTRTNIYLFRKFIFLYEALITVFLTFLLGINSSMFSLFEIEDKVLNFFINACLIAASCITTSTKTALEYTYTTWDIRHQANGDKPINDETEETG